MENEMIEDVKEKRQYSYPAKALEGIQNIAKKEERTPSEVISDLMKERANTFTLFQSVKEIIDSTEESVEDFFRKEGRSILLKPKNPWFLGYQSNDFNAQVYINIEFFIIPSFYDKNLEFSFKRTVKVMHISGMLICESSEQASGRDLWNDLFLKYGISSASYELDKNNLPELF